MSQQPKVERGPEPATETPWCVGHGWEQTYPGFYIFSEGGVGRVVVAEDEPIGIENADVIVYRVNNWDALYDENERMREQLAAGCTCGSGAHPRRCKRHPDLYDAHIYALNYETYQNELEELRTELKAANEGLATCRAAMKELAEAYDVVLIGDDGVYQRAKTPSHNAFDAWRKVVRLISGRE